MTRRSWALLAVVVLAWAAAMVWLQAERFEAGFHYEYEDDAMTHQMLWAVGEGTFPYNTIHPLHRPSHLEAILILLWPIYAVLSAFLGAWPAVWALKALILGSGAFAVAALAILAGLERRSALLWAAVWLAFPATIGLVLATFRPAALSAAPLLFVLWAFERRAFGAFVASIVITLAFREDLALAVVPLSVVAGWRRLPARYWVTALALPAAWYLAATQIVLPSILPARYEDIVFGANLGGDLLTRLTDPSHLMALLALLIPVLGLALLAPEAAVGLASVGAVMIFKGGFAGNVLHLIGPATAAAVGGAVLVHGRRFSGWGFRVPAVALGVAGLVHFTPTGLAVVATDCEHSGPASDPALCHVWSPFDPWFRTDPRAAEITAAVAKIPDGASVAAVGHLLPRLSPRRVLWEYGHADVPFGDADWIILDEQDRYAGAGRYLALGPGDVAKHLAVLEPAFRVISRSGSLVVLQRQQATAGLTDQLRPLLPRRDAPPEHRRGVRALGESKGSRLPLEHQSR